MTSNQCTKDCNRKINIIVLQVTYSQVMWAPCKSIELNTLILKTGRERFRERRTAEWGSFENREREYL